MQIQDFLSLRSQRFAEHLRSKGVDLPERFDLRSTVRSLGANLLALDSDPLTEPEVDVKEMSARFVVSTPSKDRMGDVVIPRGCLRRLDNYKRNPVVFFSHRSTDFPIGSTRKDTNSPVEVDVQEDRVLAKLYFHGMTAESELVFKLIKAGILRATSIGFIPHVAALIRDHDDEDQDEKNGLGEQLIYFGDDRIKVFPSLRFHDWELTEISVVPVPANPDALQMSLSRGHVEGQVLTTSIRKALEPYAAPLKTWSPGALLSQIPEPEMNTPHLDPQGPTPGLDPIPTETKSLEEIPSPSPTPDDPTKGWPHGAKFLAGLKGRLDQVRSYMDEECSLLDQPKVKRYATKKLSRIQRDIYKVLKLGASLYPEKFEDPGELPVEKELDPIPEPIPTPEPLPEIKKDLDPEPVLEEKSVSPTITEAINFQEVLREIQILSDRFDRMDDKFYSLTGK